MCIIALKERNPRTPADGEREVGIRAQGYLPPTKCTAEHYHHRGVGPTLTVTPPLRRGAQRLK